MKEMIYLALQLHGQMFDLVKDHRQQKLDIQLDSSSNEEESKTPQCDQIDDMDDIMFKFYTNDDQDFSKVYRRLVREVLDQMVMFIYDIDSEKPASHYKYSGLSANYLYRRKHGASPMTNQLGATLKSGGVFDFSNTNSSPQVRNFTLGSSHKKLR